jgi:rhodanese-related sulfurtransferase
MKLPPETRVYPAHGAGSLCGKQLSPEAMSTIGAERQSNYALQPMPEDRFIELVTADQPDAPAYFTYDAVLNAKERPTLDAVLERVLNPLSLDEVLVLTKAGATILDVRDAAAFADGHLVGTINIGLAGQYATWAGTLLPRDRSIVILADPGRETEAAMRLGRIGFDHVAGYLDGGMHALEGRPDLIVRTARVTPQRLASQLSRPDPPFVLDVRAPREWTPSRIDRSANIPLNHLTERLDELPTSRQIVVYCAAGYRSSIAASLLQLHGFDNIVELAGGFAAWQAQ